MSKNLLTTKKLSGYFVTIFKLKSKNSFFDSVTMYHDSP